MRTLPSAATWRSGAKRAFSIALGVILVWGITGPIGFSDTWQLVINTGTTIVTLCPRGLGQDLG